MPVTTSVYVPATCALQDNPPICGEAPKVTLVTARAHDRPVGVDGETVRETFPLSPLIALTIIVAVPEEPARIWAGEPIALIVKSTTTNVIVAVV